MPALIYSSVLDVFIGIHAFAKAQVWLPFYQEKGRSPSAAVSRGKDVKGGKTEVKVKVNAERRIDLLQKQNN